MSQDVNDSPVPNYEGWTVANDRKTEYLGLARGDTPMLYEPSTNRLYEGNLDRENERIVPREETERELDPEETLGEALESIGEKTGWDSLSSFADEHLTDDGS
ncbi:hypothetical protein [Halococcus sp. AFM35]|uniref:hypothetical protein n=1 Tax=Halococcus sp. AFM35 TaxID=3421653 RepID=UPI003EC0A2CA